MINSGDDPIEKRMQQECVRRGSAHLENDREIDVLDRLKVVVNRGYVMSQFAIYAIDDAIEEIRTLRKNLADTKMELALVAVRIGVRPAWPQPEAQWHQQLLDRIDDLAPERSLNIAENAPRK